MIRLRRCRNYVMVVCALLLLVSGASALDAVAGDDQHVSEGTLVTLDGSKSTGTNLMYKWTEGGIVLSDQVSFDYEFSPGTHEITLTVSDGNNTDTDTVIVRVNRPPVADAGGDRVVPPNTYIKLDASGSTDPDGDSLSYRWKENGEVLSTERSFSKIFDIGKHEITLTVTDNFGDDDTDTVEVVVNVCNITDTDGDGVPDVWDVDNSTPPGYWVNSHGVGRMWGDMNGDGKLTSVDALMILQAAARGIEIG